MTAAIEVESLTKRYGVTVAVDDVSFSLEAGTITGLLGRNGSGKTTLMSLVTAQTFASRGEVRVLGQHPMENDRVLQQMCFVREGQRYPSSFRVSHVLAAGRHFYPQWDADLADRLVEAYQLPRRRPVQKLSRGMTSAVGVVVGLASRAPVTIFDEPYLGLDAGGRQRFYTELMADFMEHPRTIVLSTHLIDEVSSFLDHVLVLDGGRLVVDSSAEDLRGGAVRLVGRLDKVGAVTGALPVLHEERMGQLVSRTVNGRLDDESRRLAEELGVELQPVSLQQLVIHSAGLRQDGDTDRVPAATGGTR